MARRVIPIDCHPKYKFQVTSVVEDAVVIPVDLDGIPLDEASLDIEIEIANHELEEAASRSLLVDPRDLIGPNVCYLCENRRPKNPWFLRILGKKWDSEFVCDAIRRTEIADPVSGEIKFIEKIQGLLGIGFTLVEDPYSNCRDLNQDGRCPLFEVAGERDKKRT